MKVAVETDRLRPLIEAIVEAECALYLTEEEYSYDRARKDRDAERVRLAREALSAELEGTGS